MNREILFLNAPSRARAQAVGVVVWRERSLRSRRHILSGLAPSTKRDLGDAGEREQINKLGKGNY